MDELPVTEAEPKGKALGRWLLNPFYYMAGGKALAIGMLAMLLTGYFAFLGKMRFNGIIDARLGISAAPLLLNIFEILASWLLLSILLIICGWILSKSRIRVIDVIGTQALARFPYLLVSLVALLPGARRFAQKDLTDLAVWQAFSWDMVLFFFLYLTILVMLIWMVVLMYRAFAVSCNVKGTPAISFFIAALIIGEILSFIIIRLGIPAALPQPTDLTYRAGEFATIVSREEYGTAVKMFDKTMLSLMPEEKLEEVWRSLTVKYGPFKAQGPVRIKKLLPSDVYLIPCEFSKITLNMQISFDGTGKIDGLYFQPFIGEADQTWVGAPEIDGTTLRIMFRVFHEPDGSLYAYMDSPDQGITDIPVTSTVMKDGMVRFEVGAIGLVFEGKMRENGLAIEGVIIQRNVEVPAVLDLVDTVSPEQ